MKKIIAVLMLTFLVSIANYSFKDGDVSSEKDEVKQVNVFEELKSGLYKCIKIVKDENTEGDFAIRN